ncbi:MAG: hypothetical protein JWR10_4305 [Rubritepida sp.]|nr:hypothetical protein [Rubritepida sp.]
MTDSAALCVPTLWRNGIGAASRRLLSARNHSKSRGGEAELQRGRLDGVAVRGAVRSWPSLVKRGAPLLWRAALLTRRPCPRPPARAEPLTAAVARTARANVAAAATRTWRMMISPRFAPGRPASCGGLMLPRLSSLDRGPCRVCRSRDASSSPRHRDARCRAIEHTADVRYRSAAKTAKVGRMEQILVGRSALVAGPVSAPSLDSKWLAA